MKTKKSAFKYLKQSMALDPDNRDAVIGHAYGVSGVYDQGFVVRKLAELNLKCHTIMVMT